MHRTDQHHRLVATDTVPQTDQLAANGALPAGERVPERVENRERPVFRRRALLVKVARRKWITDRRSIASNLQA
ncbi:MAG: hypothetical protein ACI9IV_000657 [Paracoccaceae bacterium]